MKIVLDAMKMQTKKEAHTYLKTMLELPEYYGGNLDALYDCLQEKDMLEIDIYNLTTENKYARVCAEVMCEAGIKVNTL